MKQALLLPIFVLMGQMAMADSATVTIKKMHCGGCVDAVKMNLCKLPGIDSKNCKVEIGSAQISSVEGAKLDQAAVKKAVEDAGYEFAEMKTK